MKIYDFKKNIDNKKLSEVANAIKKGKLVVFPTETVYGIGANALDDNAIKNIFKAKNRPTDNPLIVHVSNKEMINKVAKNITEIEELLIDKFMPGPFTILLEKRDIIPDVVTCSMKTVGVRMPSNEIARRIIELSNTPIAAPSANVSGKPSGTDIHDIIDELKNKVDYIIDGGKCKIGLESTVVKVENDKVKILRPGKIIKEDIEKLGVKVEIDNHTFKKISDNDERVESPGMKYRHYSPEAKTILVYFDNEETMIKKIIGIILGSNINLNDICIIGFSEHKKRIQNYSNEFRALNYVDIGSKNNFDEISKNIFSSLRKSDEYNSKLCIIEGVKKQGLGIAIMNRLFRASTKYIEDIY